jgi:hypothetical protein
MAKPFKQELWQQKLAYSRQRCQARFRAEPWSDEFTFDEWWQIWQPNWLRRGRGTDDLVMVRRDIAKAWHQQNVDLWRRGDWLRQCGEFYTRARWRRWRETGQGSVGNWRKTS